MLPLNICKVNNATTKEDVFLMNCVLVADKPECAIDRQDGGIGEDAQIMLHCRASANPDKVEFRSVNICKRGTSM